MIKKCKLAILFWFIYLFSSAQVILKERNSFLSAGYSQDRESANFGLVFRGPDINYGMAWLVQNEKRILDYKYELGTGVLFAKDIPGLGFYLKPVDLACLFKFPLDVKNLYFGPSVQIEYNYFLYPDLQSAFDYWFSNYSLGARIHYDLSYKKSSFRINLNTSLLGFVSRQPAYREPYYYDIGFSHAIDHLNNDLTPGSWNMYNTTRLEILCKLKPGSRCAFGYEFKYTGYSRSPEITMITQNVTLFIGKKQK